MFSLACPRRKTINDRVWASHRVPHTRLTATMPSSSAIRDSDDEDGLSPEKLPTIDLAPSDSFFDGIGGPEELCGKHHDVASSREGIGNHAPNLWNSVGLTSPR